jgi:hypothetical protein
VQVAEPGDACGRVLGDRVGQVDERRRVDLKVDRRVVRVVIGEVPDVRQAAEAGMRSQEEALEEGEVLDLPFALDELELRGPRREIDLRGRRVGDELVCQVPR